MSFDEFEYSNYGGAPTTLFEFTLGTTTWRYSNGQHNATYLGNVYTALPIKHGDIVMSGDTSTDDLTVTIAASAPVTAMFHGTPPSESIQLTIRDIHRGDTEAPVIWSGLVKSGKQTSGAQFEFSCNSLLSTLNRNGLRLAWGRGCPHALYDRNCRVDLSSHGVATQVTSISNNVLTSSAFASFSDNWFSGGFVTFSGSFETVERRAIESHSGSEITLLSPSDGIQAGDWIVAYPGCDRVTSTCVSKFNNLANYGGFPHLPTKSPFDGDPVF